MIGLDLDGTLLTDKKEILPYTKRVLDEVISRGVIVLPVTGRSANAVPEMIMKYPGIRYAVTSNGARVMDTARNEVVFENLISYETSMQILEIMGRYDALREIYYEGQGYLDREVLGNIEHYHRDPFFGEYIRMTRKAVSDIMELAESRHCAMENVLGLFADEKEHQLAWSELERRTDISMSASGENTIEVTAAGVNKGTALVELGRLLGIGRDEIMACGDGDNDVEMLRAAGIGVAMANAAEHVKVAADYVGLSNEEEGAAKAIETLLGLTEGVG